MGSVEGDKDLGRVENEGGNGTTESNFVDEGGNNPIISYPKSLYSIVH